LKEALRDAVGCADANRFEIFGAPDGGEGEQIDGKRGSEHRKKMATPNSGFNYNLMLLFNP